MLYVEIAGGENARAALDYLKHYRSSRMLAMDPDYGVMRAYGATGWPRFLVLDRQGIVRFSGIPGDSRLRAIRRRLRGLVAATPPGLASGLVLREGVCYPKSVLAARDAERNRSPRLAVRSDGRPVIAYCTVRNGRSSLRLRQGVGPGRPADPMVTDPREDCYAPDIAFDDSGTLWLAWCGRDDGRYDIYVQRRPASGAPATVRLTRSSDDAMAPRLATGPGGRVAVTYYKWRRMRGVSRDRDIFARAYDPAAGSWRGEIEISPHEPQVEDHTDPDVVFGPNGGCWVAWSYDYHPSLFPDPVDTDQPSVFAAKLRADGATSPPMLAGTPGRGRAVIDLFPSLAVDGKGTLWCAWDAGSLRTGQRRIVLSALRGEGVGFDRQRVLSRPGRTASTPELSPGLDDTLLATWSEWAGGRWLGRAALVREGAVVSETDLLDDGDVQFVQAAAGPDGKLWVTYECSSETGSRVVLEQLRF